MKRAPSLVRRTEFPRWCRGQTNRRGRPRELAIDSGWCRDGIGTDGIGTQSGDVVDVVHGERADVGHIIFAGIVAVEEIEKFDEGRGGKALANFNRAADAQVHLDIRGATQTVERSFHSIDHNAVGAIHIGDGEGTRAFCLGQGSDLESGGKTKYSRKDKTVTSVFSRRTIVTGTERIRMDRRRR